MAQLYDEDGNPVEALTEEEIEARILEEKEKAKEEVSISIEQERVELEEKLKEKEQEAEDLKTALEKEQSKEKNLSGQRQVITKKDKEIDELKTQIGSLQTKMDQEFSDMKSQGRDRMIKNMVTGLSGGNQDIADKIKLFYDSFKGDVATEEEIEERIRNAYLLATGGEKPRSVLNSRIISSASGSPSIKTNGEKLSSEVVELAKNMGIEEKDLKKHKLI
jgi:chromosome segregation ATPase